MKLLIDPDAEVRYLHEDTFKLKHAGNNASVKRASHVEPWALLSDAARSAFERDNPLAHSVMTRHPEAYDVTSLWFVDLSPSCEPGNPKTLGPFNTRASALEAEKRWLENSYTTPTA